MINTISYIDGEHLHTEVYINGPSEMVTEEFISIFKAIYGGSKEDAHYCMEEIKNFLQEVLEDGTIKS